MAGLLAMEEERLGTGPKLPLPLNEEENILIQIANIFQEGNEDWCKILIGDIGRRFKFDKNDLRIKAEAEEYDPMKKIKMIGWLPPENIELSYNEKKGGIIYIHHLQKPLK